MKHILYDMSKVMVSLTKSAVEAGRAVQKNMDNCLHNFLAKRGFTTREELIALKIRINELTDNNPSS